MTSRDKFVHGMLFILFGIFVPWIKGLPFMDLQLLAVYSCLGFLFVSPRVVDDVFGAGKRVDLLSLAKSIAYGWIASMAMIALGLITVNIGLPRRVMPPLVVLLSLAILSLLLSIIVGSLSAVVAQQSTTPDKAKSPLRISFLLLLCAMLAAPRLLSESLQDQFLSLTMADKFAWFTLWSAPILAMSAAASVVWAVRRGKLVN